jgi:hypothetical protein
MSQFTSVTADAITIRMELEPVTFKLNGKDVLMHKLPHPLAFSRKAADLSELSGGAQSYVYVFKRIDMDTLGFDHFARNLCRDTDWLKDQYHAIPVNGARACVMVLATGRPILFIDTQGSDYARYVARLG